VSLFSGFRRLVEALQTLTDALFQLAEIQRGLGPALERLEDLERSRTHFEANVEGMLLKADGKLKASMAAEQRERQLKRANEKRADEFDLISETVPAPGPLVLGDDAPPSHEEGVPPVHLAVAPSNKARALNAKWGR